MKNLVLCFIPLCFALFLQSCTTFDRVMSNSEGYVLGNPAPEIKRRKTPDIDWLDTDGSYEKWVAYQVAGEASGEYRYFLGQSVQRAYTSSKIVPRTEQEASDMAFIDVTSKIATAVSVNVNLNALVDKGHDGNKMRSAGSSRKEIAAKVRLENLEQVGRFTETRQYGTDEGTTDYVNCWLVYRISKENMQKVLDRIAANESVEETEKRMFADQSERAYKSIGNLQFYASKNNIAQNKDFTREYEELIKISGEIKLLTGLKEKKDEEYNRLVYEVNDAIKTYDPSQSRELLIDILYDQIKKRDEIIADRNARLEVYGQYSGQQLGAQQYSGQQSSAPPSSVGFSVPIIVPYPPRPAETLISDASIYASNYMVNNHDFILFLNMNGLNSLSRGEQGLESPATLLSWNDAARYCNWLSRLYGYNSCYTEVKGQITGFDKTKNGYRLPTQSEITAILNAKPSIVNEAEFVKIAAWSGESAQGKYKSYKLDSEVRRLKEQPISNAMTDINIGFRMVRNAK